MRQLLSAGLLLGAVLLVGCGEPEEADVAGYYDGGFPPGSHYDRLTVDVVTEAGSDRIFGRGWFRREGADLRVPVVTGTALHPASGNGGREAILLLLEHDGVVSTLYAHVGRSGHRLEGVFNGRGGGTTISLRRLRTRTSP